jgi:prepilin-type N-terminal cleavage/methylation domain-containing protein
MQYAVMNKRNQCGFTLIELMTTLLVAGVVRGIGVPTFNQFIATNQMVSGVNDLTSSLHLARTEAVKRRANVTICPSANPFADPPACDNTGSFADGWIIFVDCTVAAPPAGTCGAPNYAVADRTDILNAHGPMIDDLANNFSTFSTNPNVTPGYITYSPTGFTRTIPVLGAVQPISDFQLCDHRGNQNVGANIAAGRWIRISPTGRPQIFREVGEIQSAQNPLNGC